MAKVDQTKANMLLSATKTMSLGANKNSIRILYGNHVAENTGLNLNKTLKKGFVGGVAARITAGLFLRLLMSL
ncbi:hypothetical protein LRS40_00005 (plasmid) [Leclercia sp. G3L]|uniref:hypothetical protein n=1 Tax=Leclercia sp. G3L TaxID=2898725 RepID=UPI001E63770E|nr:hypothetical protein [Leclercia sp. G3L]UGB00519.1 hypothetical protein LRS40_00005 [Leclercia sp. G3L]